MANSYIKKANKILKGVDNKINVTNFGDVELITGNAVIVKEDWTNLKGLFYIDSDTHTWENGLYTNKLTLNYKNLVDEVEAGSEDKEETSSNESKKESKKGKGTKKEKKKKSAMEDLKFYLD